MDKNLDVSSMAHGTGDERGAREAIGRLNVCSVCSMWRHSVKLWSEYGST